MSLEVCCLCKSESTPWFHINGHICEDCYQGNKWISVKDRLPDKKQKVLGFYYNEMLKTHCIDALYFEKPNKFYNNIVTHWMPLPEPPKCE